MKSCLVTGSTGHLGRRLVAAVAAQGIEVHCPVRPSADTSALRQTGAKIHVLDRGIQDLYEILASHVVDTVFHLAAHQPRRDDYAEVQRTLEANLDYGTHLLAAAQSAGVKRLVNTGSFWQYGPSGERRPNSLYAATKAAFQDLMDHYCRTHGLRALTLVLYDVYGPRDPRGKLLSQIVELSGTGSVLDTTEGRQRISLVHVDDVVTAFLRASELLGEIGDGEHRVYFVHGEVRTLREWVERALQVLPEAPSIAWGKLSYRDDQIMEPYVGPRLPGWEARTQIEDGVTGMLQ
jgi:nucleoside-diphosphate-sugar epimerase